jgi:ribosomal protein S12 methylthiotransferase
LWTHYSVPDGSQGDPEICYLIIVKKQKKVSIITLGCAKNLVDSEVLMRQLDASGFEFIHNSDDSDARTIIINTCGFINDAKQESIDTILKYVHAKKSGQIKFIYVIGCLSERYKEELPKEIPEVDGWFGVNDFQRIVTKLGGNFKEELFGERWLATPSHYAYLKISEGCDRLCSFCAIPLIRGKQKSRPLEDLIKETSYLADKGVKELILIAQDLTAYGTDIYGKQSLQELLNGLTKISGIEWIRLHYTYPANFPLKVLELMAGKNVICKYLDIPFQHISDKVLDRMHRSTSRSEILKLIGKIRDMVQGIAIRTTLLVGHPGEGEKEFKELVDFVKVQQFERLGVFTYSEEQGTFASKHYKDIIPLFTKQKRFEEIMEIQRNISLNINQKKIGSIYNVLIDSRKGEFAIGRTEFDSPEVDNEVLVKDPEARLEPGKFYKIRITGAEDYDLIGEVSVSVRNPSIQL